MTENFMVEKRTAEKKFERKKYLWEYDTTTAFGQDIEISGDMQAFVQVAMQENLSHVRHIENERMSLLVGVSALVAGILAIGGQMITDVINNIDNNNGFIKMFLEIIPALVIFGVTLVVVIIAKLLNSRWNLAFDRHIYYAKGCYYLLHNSLFENKGVGDNEESETEDCLIKNKKGNTQKMIKLSRIMFNEEFKLPTNLNNSASISTMPLYCFDINKNISKITHKKKMGTKKCFDVFYNILIAVVAVFIILLVILLIYFGIIKR